jgi:hypothetical protein
MAEDKVVARAMNAAFATDVLLHWPIRQSILLVGDHGVGKDGIIKTVAQIQNVPCVDIRLSQNDVGDIKGMPFRVKGRTVFAPPDWMPFKEEEDLELEDLMGQVATAASKKSSLERGILFLNEINRATREVQQAAFELVLDRTMNTRALRDGWRIIAAINGDEHYQVNVMDVAFKSRFYIIKFRPSVEEWLNWAAKPVAEPVKTNPEVLKIISAPITGPLHPTITSLIKLHPRLLDPSEELLTQAETDVTMQVQNRRAWEMFSDCLKTREALAAIGEVPEPIAKDRSSLDYLQMMGMGYVGALASIEYMRYIETDYESLSGDIILNRWNKSVAEKVKAIIDAGKVIEISRYSDMIVEEIAESKSKVIPSAQKKNLTAYLKLLTKEMTAHLWKNMLGKCREACMDWYGDKTVQDLILDALKTPAKADTAK